MKLCLFFHIVFFLTVLQPRIALADRFTECVLDYVNDSQYQNMSIAQLREKCQIPAPTQTDATEACPRKKNESLIAAREKADAAVFNIAGIEPHKQNYFLPLTYSSTTNGAAFSSSGERVDNMEMKFQISLKYPVKLPPDIGTLYLAYTNLSFWQAYNKPFSSPFREINHEPEGFIKFKKNWLLPGIDDSRLLAGFVHQSNGRSGAESRSWNRLYLNFIFEKNNWVFSLKPWYRIPEKDKTSPTDTSGDDNPDISRFMGYGEFRILALLPHFLHGSEKDLYLGLMLRNNLRDNGNKGAVQLDFGIPMGRGVKLYFQYFNGYGESLIDYNASVNRIGAGLMFMDWLK